MRLVFLGNEFLEEDSLAKKIGEILKNDFEVINVRDSFELMSLLNESGVDEIILIDVVENLNEVKKISVDELRNDSILSAHDFDAGFVLKLVGKNFKIIGIPQKGNVEEIKRSILKLL
ncbi:MAG: hypothetical protein PVJ67_02685 [Candidatus Pacearchaeota archaeon]|jgi:Ni,Fe-hydrogenase maturation factor